MNKVQSIKWFSRPSNKGMCLSVHSYNNQSTVAVLGAEDKRKVGS